MVGKFILLNVKSWCRCGACNPSHHCHCLLPSIIIFCALLLVIDMWGSMYSEILEVAKSNKNLRTYISR